MPGSSHVAGVLVLDAEDDILLLENVRHGPVGAQHAVPRRVGAAPPEDEPAHDAAVEFAGNVGAAAQDIHVPPHLLGLGEFAFAEGRRYAANAHAMVIDDTLYLGDLSIRQFLHGRVPDAADFRAGDSVFATDQARMRQVLGNLVGERAELKHTRLSFAPPCSHRDTGERRDIARRIQAGRPTVMAGVTSCQATRRHTRQSASCFPEFRNRR